MIVEGPDGSGKTTLVNRLSHDLGVPVKTWPEDRNEMASVGVFRRVFSSLAYEVSASSAEPPVLHDRLYFSEIVYGTILRGKVAFTPDQRRLIVDTLRGLRIPLIFCRPPLEVVQANIAASAGIQLEGVPEHVEPLWELYASVAPRGFKTQKVLYDYTGRTQPSSSYERVLARCSAYLDRRARRTWQS